MKIKLNCLFIALVLSSALNAQLFNASAQGTAFTYQGRLNSGSSPANGTYDMRFYLYNDPTAGSIVAGPITNSPTVVSNGLFTATLDFGNVYNGTVLWLHVGVRTNGGAAFTGLSPRQQLTPTPYAVFAEGANAAGLSGPIPAGDLSGVNGGGLVSLNASQLSSGTVADARLSANVALLDHNQTFTGTDIFASGGGAGRLIVSNTFTAVDTSLFTGLSLQYDASFGEGALMSSYNDGTAYLSFYTKPSFGVPITKQMIISAYGNVAIDQGNNNNGVLNNSALTGAGLTFGTGSGEGIASKRTAGGDQYGLDFYTGFVNRMSILNNGFVGIGRQTQVSGAELFGLYSPVTNTWGGMYIQTGSGGRPFYGYSSSGTAWSELDGTDGNKWKLYNSGYWLAVTPSGSVGIGTMSPNAAALDVASGDVRIDSHDLFLTSSSTTNNGFGLGYRTGYTNGITGDGPFLYGYNGGCLGGLGPTTTALSWDWQGNIWVNKNCSVGTLTIRGGADLAEPFNISAGKSEVPEGAVVVIDDQNPGQLKLSDSPYDTHVAGVVSGANGVNPGIQMHQQGIIEGGKNVALTGRVYVRADASNGAIRPGDMLTTSSTPGHAMKVSDHAKAAGAILGKAMTGLSEGKGMVLVLVTLQ